MSQFIESTDNVLSQKLCQQLVKQFEQSKHQVAGRTGGGVDTSKKLSQDIYLNQHKEFQPLLQQVQQATSEQLFKYFEKHFFYFRVCCLLFLIKCRAVYFGKIGGVFLPDTSSPMDNPMAKHPPNLCHGKTISLI